MIAKLITGDIALRPVEVIDEGVFVSAGHLPTSDEYPLLSRIDPYGDTVFNHLQMDRLLEEWGRLERTKTSPEERTIHKRIRELAERCRKAQQGVLLLFQGD